MFDWNRWLIVVGVMMNEYRKRSLVAIGTHNLDVITGPFSYEALPQSETFFFTLPPNVPSS